MYNYNSGTMNNKNNIVEELEHCSKKLSFEFSLFEYKESMIEELVRKFFYYMEKIKHN